MSMPTEPDPSAAEPVEDAVWPPHVPHREIDALIESLRGVGSAGPVEAHRLLRLVAKEAERLRALSLRLTSAKLAEADREASSIIAEAVGHADSMRSLSLSVLNNRLDESERLIAALREAFRVERRAAEGAAAAEQQGPSTSWGEGR